MNIELQRPVETNADTTRANVNFRPVELSQFDHKPDVIVVGARIAGAVAAYNLARKGKNVLVIDKENILEETKPPCSGCGGLVQSKAVKLLESIGIELPENLIRQRLDGYILHLPHGGILDIATPGLLALDRGFGPIKAKKQKGLDAFILEKAIKAGAKFLVAKVDVIELAQKGKAIITAQDETCTSDFVIGAFGHNNFIRKKINMPALKQEFLLFMSLSSRMIFTMKFTEQKYM